MNLKEIELNQFRNISKEKIEFSKQINLIHGRNGQGKTSILEAIFFLSITKSFRAKTEKIVLQHDSDYLQVAGLFETDKNDTFSVRLYYSNDEGKHIFVNQNKLDKFSQLIGKSPLTLLSLEDLELTYGVPANRRKFLDILLSQTSPVYLQALQSYKKVLAHRNRLLSLIAENKEKSVSLFPWDEQLVKYGSEIIMHRQQFAEYANQKIGTHYQKISLRNEKVNIRYKSNCLKAEDKKNLNKLEDEYAQNMQENLDGDIHRQNTLIGPHRDDLIFYKDDYALKQYGSQGENKTLLIALKLVESMYLKEKSLEGPILLMDDIFGELDDTRIHNLLEYVTDFGQTFITTTSKDKFSDVTEDKIAFFQVKEGKVIQ